MNLLSKPLKSIGRSLLGDFLVISTALFFSSNISPVNCAGTEVFAYEGGIGARRSYQELLKEIDTLFEVTPKVGRLKFISQPFNIEGKRTHPLALAVCLGDAGLVGKFLLVVKDINAKKLDIWGYRQPYTMAHLALDPQFPEEFEVELDSRLAIIDLLGVWGANFNTIREKHTYENPPLAAGYPSGHPVKDYQALQARALLYGADPTLKGSSFYGLDGYSNLKEVYGIALDQLTKMADCKLIKIHPHTQMKMKAEEEMRNKKSTE